MPTPSDSHAGVVAYRTNGDSLEILLVTSRRTGEWGLPKGHLEPGMTAAEVATMEAFEEAGVQGAILGEPLGRYVRRGSTVVVFAMEVGKVLERWPEESERRRAWFALDQAVAAVPEAELKSLLSQLRPSRPGPG